MEYYRLCVDFFKVEIDTIRQFCFGFDANPPQHLLRHFAEKSLNHIQPGTMFRCEYKVKPARDSYEILSCFLKTMNPKVIKYQPDFISFGIFIIEYLKKSYVVSAD